jgi:hypothetical protein
MKMRMFSTSCVARHDLPRLGLVVVGVAQPLEVVVDLVADVVGDFLAHRLAQVLLAEGGYPSPHGESDDGQCREHEQALVAIETDDLAVLADRLQPEIDGVTHEERADHDEAAREDDGEHREGQQSLIGLQESAEPDEDAHETPLFLTARLAHLNAYVKDWTRPALASVLSMALMWVSTVSPREDAVARGRQ